MYEAGFKEVQIVYRPSGHTANADALSENPSQPAPGYGPAELKIQVAAVSLELCGIDLNGDLDLDSAESSSDPARKRAAESDRDPVPLSEFLSVEAAESGCEQLTTCRAAESD